MSTPLSASPICTVFIATSLDGFIARRDGGLDWLERVAVEGEDYGYKALMESIDTMVLGRHTYETALSFPEWPYAGKRCLVLTHGAFQSRHGEEFFAGTIPDAYAELTRRGCSRAYVDGGVVIRAFLDAGLIHELTISRIPVLLGDGIPLFAPGMREHGLHLQECRAYPSGLVRTRYSFA